MTQRVLFFHYVLTNNKGETLDSSREAEPLAVLEGTQQIIPGLEEEIFKMKTGEKKVIEVPAAKAYGPINDQLKVKVKRDQLPEGEIEPGARFRGGNEEAQFIFTVLKVEGDDVTLDGNHPLAGEDLTFDVEITGMREATPEELQHGHLHGPGGHQH
jgi:FKBP-type peptidyl-prolyl cis-trans isomerase SlyD